MSIKQVYPGLPPLSRGTSCPLKLDIKGEKLLYKQGNTVVLRDIKPAADGSIGVQLYTQHLYPVTAAAMAPSGCYVASGDDHGNLASGRATIPTRSSSSRRRCLRARSLTLRGRATRSACWWWATGGRFLAA